MLQQICKISSICFIWLLMLHDKPCIQFCLFVCLFAVGHALLSYAHWPFSRADSSGVAPCIILCFTWLKPILKYGSYHVERFRKTVIPIFRLFVKISRKNCKSSMLEKDKMCFNSRCQPPWLVILEKVSHVEFNIFEHNFAINCDIDKHI